MLALIPGAAFARDGELVSRRPYASPAWDSLGRPERFVDRADLERALADARFRMERVEYRSDSLVVPAYVMRPAKPATRPLPCVVFVRGSWRVGDIGWQLAPTLHRLARRGYLVVAPLIRGSDGSAGMDEMGGADLGDVMATRTLAASLGADTTRLLLFGESRGGMMALLVMAHGFPARAAVTVGAFTDLDSMIAADTTALAPVARAVWPDWPERHDAIAARRSAARWPERLRAPVLLMHGGDDRQLRPAHATRLADAIRAAGGVAEARVFDGAGHTLRGREAERDSLADRWFQRALRPGK